ncbi:MAG: saccharopine dehydrogenase C-terminal domain-containing protein [Anaerolineae bacterium]|jgi:saccharopine dehydrogenase (NADP+, L-glutamate forming)/spermidine synthase
MKNVLVLGAGLVARPLVEYLLDQRDVHVTVASRTVSKAEALVDGRANGRAVAFNITRDSDQLDAMVTEADLAVSLLPYTFHVQVARHCVKHGCHLVTTSYVKDQMRALDAQAREAGVILLNEIGLDPGIDHMSAMKIIDHIHAAGGEVTSFRSYCGGLPAPDANDNPLGYKFSWSPRGVILAGRNDARFLENGQTVTVPNARLFATHTVTWVEGLGDLEAYPNRDSIPYIDLYTIPETKTMYRGTLRNLGWCDVMQKLNALGYFSLERRDDLAGRTFRQVMAELVGAEDTDDLRGEVASALNVAPNSGVMMTIGWLGLLDDVPVPAKDTLLDILAAQMLTKMRYRKGERDMIVLLHDFVARYPDRTERITSTLLDFGVPGGNTSMARTVGLPAAVAARFILEGRIRLAGVHIPVVPAIYKPVLEELERLGIEMEETVEQLE